MNFRGKSSLLVRAALVLESFLLFLSTRRSFLPGPSSVERLPFLSVHFLKVPLPLLRTYFPFSQRPRNSLVIAHRLITYSKNVPRFFFFLSLDFAWTSSRCVLFPTSKVGAFGPLSSPSRISFISPYRIDAEYLLFHGFTFVLAVRGHDSAVSPLLCRFSSKPGPSVALSPLFPLSQLPASFFLVTSIHSIDLGPF